jgi:hypothetical protein
MKRWPYLLILAVLIAGVAASSIRNIPRIAEARMPMVVMSGSTPVAGGGGCTGNYGETEYDGTMNDASNSAVGLTKVTIDCSATSGTIYFYSEYNVHPTLGNLTHVIYDADGDLVWSGADENADGSPGWSDEEFSGVSLSSGDYYIGAQCEGTGSRFGYKSSVGDSILWFNASYGSVPASVTLGSPDSTTSNTALTAYLAF